MGDIQEKTSPVVEANGKRLWEKALEKAPALLVAFTTSLYVIGYLVVTSQMASKGVHDQPFISSKYVMAWGFMCVAAVMYYFFVWRKVARRARSGIRFSEKPSKAFEFYVTHYYVIDDAFGCVVFSSWLVSLASHQKYAPFFMIGSLTVAGIDRMIFDSTWATRHRVAAFAISGVLLGVACMTFGVAALFVTPYLAVFLIAWTFTCVTIIVLTSSDWQAGKDRVYGASYLAISAIILAVTFGSTAYGYFNPRFGGGAAPRVRPTLSDDAEESIRRSIADVGKDVFLLAEDKETITLELGSETSSAQVLRMDRSLVRALMFEHPAEANAYSNLLSDLLPIPNVGSASSPSAASAPQTRASEPAKKASGS